MVNERIEQDFIEKATWNRKRNFLPKDKVKTQVQFIDEHKILCPVYFWMRQFIFGMGLQRNFQM